LFLNPDGVSDLDFEALGPSSLEHDFLVPESLLGGVWDRGGRVEGDFVVDVGILLLDVILE